MNLSEKIAAAAAQAQHNEAEAYSTIEQILRDRPWPAWLKRVAADVDSEAVTKDRPTNLEANHG